MIPEKLANVIIINTCVYGNYCQQLQCKQSIRADFMTNTLKYLMLFLN